MSSNQPEASASTSQATSSQPLKLPKKGYFSIADPKAEVYSKAGEKFDPTKKGGRYQPEFIWNTNWQEMLEREESLNRRREEAMKAPKEVESGFLSFSRLSTLDDMNVDLSEQLRVRKQKDEEEKAAQAAAAAAAASSSRAGEFSRKEAAKLQRVSRSVARGAAMATAPTTTAETEAERLRVAAEEKRKYEQLKLEFQLWTLAYMAIGGATTYIAYDSNVSASYLAGALGGLVYLRLLGRGVDGLASSPGLQEGLGNIAGQQRLLIPVILALGYNRWNLLASESTGITLQLLPMLVGFFTYKFAVVSRQAKDVLDAAVGKLEGTK